MDIRKVKKLIELVEESSIDELEIHEAEESVRISRNRQPAPVQYLAPPAVSTAPVPTVGVTAPPAAANEVVLPDGHAVTAPMVGTFYQSSAPDQKPFVTLGQRVAVGDTLCIIEAMKILNPIESDQAGLVRAMLVDDAQPVEFGQPLFVIDTD
jgi:acetyl-CoA carboxylase biotin carboxyl carrier protein